MTLPELTALLFRELNNLPGEKAHTLMTPYKRPSAKSIIKSDTKPKLSAVLMLLYEKKGIPHFTLIQRTEYNGTHGGQISFPGGKQEKGESIKKTALRETFEEIGITQERIQILGELTQVYVPPSNFLITPFIGFLDSSPNFVPEKKEVAKILEIKVNDLLNNSLIKQKKVKVGKYTDTPLLIEVPYFELNYNTVWGATATILSEVRQLLLNGLNYYSDTPSN